MISPTCNNLSETSRTINDPGHHERVVCIPEFVEVLVEVKNSFRFSKVERIMCHYRGILDVDDYALESQLSFAKLHLLKCDTLKMELVQAIKVLSNPPIAYSAVPKLVKLVATLPVCVGGGGHKMFFFGFGGGLTKKRIKNMFLLIFVSWTDISRGGSFKPPPPCLLMDKA